MYSILDGENRLESLVEQAKNLGMHQVALTDHGTMMGILEFYKLCKKNDIKPVLGSEVYITGDRDGLEKESRTKDNHHLVLVCKNNKGLENLMWLVSQAQLQNFYYKPRISKHNLTPERVEGLVATSACLGGEVNRVGEWDKETRTYNNVERMYEAAAWYHEVFGDDYYLEIQDNDDEEEQQKTYNGIVKDIGTALGIKNVITADAHYTTIESADTHSALMAMQLGMTLEQYNSGGQMKYGPWFFVRSPQQMLEAARKYDNEEAFWNACRIGLSCQADFDLGNYQMPQFDITQEEDYKEFLEEQK